jgi:hypothetical protein
MVSGGALRWRVGSCALPPFKLESSCCATEIVLRLACAQMRGVIGPMQRDALKLQKRRRAKTWTSASLAS